jgi:hypothetical protein
MIRKILCTFGMHKKAKSNLSWIKLNKGSRIIGWCDVCGKEIVIKKG